MARPTPVDVGSAANDGNGDTLRASMQTVNLAIADYVSQTDTSDQSIASNLDFGSGKGVSFDGGDVLDDYEEGTWTPEISTTAVDFASVTYDSGVTGGIYTKIGRVVYIQGAIRTDAVTGEGSATGSIIISGLPFASGTHAGHSERSALTIGSSSAWLSNPTGGFVISSSSEITIRNRPTHNSDDMNLVPSDVGTGASANIIRFSIFYTV